ncbi:hypothetical protein SARC_06381 [Sphaeroforma arctica JP610]|uniref:Class II aldolase/adducin N-terminal domain-containing protein n=1 Tax=Sphaeroforma arctica JP610 TaxID=667725 RepID=A0A0L0FXK6_9EUKA|nr:hypothetical protein SARC_06381 [Sphaeroforma arctica JP610]KNC81291.1 hypothetical protein SARC_06381 [Sphaeroforma arctica JP610]|eukprot:XP_014155193.1 hypothetical protein SARC_06381 [Sphaeroforma arctica JP610]
MHIHHPPTMAVSAMKCGLLPLTQDSCILGKISYHNYEGIAIDKKEIESLGRDCGETNRVMMLKNHGALTLGRSVGEMFLLMYYVVKSCESQVQAFSAGGIDAVHQIPQATRELVHKQATSFNAEVGKTEFEYLRRQLNNVSTEYMN